jgi:ATP phosphoribosyltransferase
MKAGLIDAAVGGLDDLIEGDAKGELILDFGTFRSSILLLGNGARGPFENVASQFPRLARKLLAQNRIPYKKLTPIWGGAETWLRLGAADACIDTWHTGATARAHGLTSIAHLGETSFCMVARKDRGKRLEGVLEHLSLSSVDS